MREQKPEVRNLVMKRSSLKKDEDGKPDIDELDAAIEFFQPQFKAPAISSVRASGEGT